MKRVDCMYPSISPAELAEKLANENVALLDVREVSQFQERHISKAQSIPFGELPQKISELDKQTNYFIICHAGVRSQQAADFLTDNGFQVTNILGGMMAWEGETVADN